MTSMNHGIQPNQNTPIMYRFGEYTPFKDKLSFPLNSVISSNESCTIENSIEPCDSDDVQNLWGSLLVIVALLLLSCGTFVYGTARLSNTLTPLIHETVLDLSTPTHWNY